MLDDVCEKDAGSINNEVEAIDKEQEDFTFPPIEEFEPEISEFRLASDERIVQVVKQYAKKNPSPSFLTHMRSRNLLYSINIVLNEKGVIAPAFRPFRRLNKPNGLSHGEKILGVDQQVTDLHYLFENYKGQITPTDEEYKPLFNSDKFDFKLAVDFAKEEWQTETKIASLNIPINIQLELGVYCCKSIRDRRRNIEIGLPEIKRRLLELAARPESRLTDKDVYDRLDQYRCLKLAKGSPSKAVRLMKLVVGRKYDEEMISGENKKFSKAKSWLKNNINIRGW